MANLHRNWQRFYRIFINNILCHTLIRINLVLKFISMSKA